MVLICEGHIFYGFIVAGGRRYTFDINMTKNNAKNEGFLHVDWRLQRDLGEALNCFLKDRHQFTDPLEFYEQFSTFVQNNVKTFKPIEPWLQSPLKTAILVKILQQELIKVGDCIKNFDLKTGLVDIEVTDCQSRIHKAVLKLGQNYKNEPITIVSIDLPQHTVGSEHSFNLDNLYSVEEFCEKFSELVTHFQQFWSAMSLLDAQCCVLDPTNPSFRDVFRRIKLNDNMSVMLTFNPFCPNQRPNLKLLGRQSEVNYYQNILQKNLENDLWNDEEDLLFNLSNILELSVPSKFYMEEPMAVDSTEPKECAICFIWELEGKIPGEVCENQFCKLIFHSACLYTYLSSVPRNRDYFGKIQGECPNCNDAIFCSVPKLL